MQLSGAPPARGPPRLRGRLADHNSARRKELPMKNILISGALAALVLGLAGPAEAARHGGHRGRAHVGRPHGGRGSGYGRSHVKVYAPRPTSRPRYGHTFRYGYYYRGRHHPRWTRTYYWPRYRTTCYWDPGTSCWYYWCATEDCYYPITYIAIAAPVVTAAPAG